MRICRCFALVAVTLLAACASSPKTSKYSPVAIPENKSVLYLFNTCYEGRSWSWGPNLFVDGKKRTRLDNQYFQRLVLEPGAHNVRIGPNWNLKVVPDLEMDIETKAGEEYFVQAAIVNAQESWGYGGTGLTLSQSLDWEMREVPKDEAQNHLKHCHIKE